MQQDRATRMGDRDAVAHAGGGQLLPCQQHVKNKVAFDIGGLGDIEDPGHVFDGKLHDAIRSTALNNLNR
jgi:hypothetical protein